MYVNELMTMKGVYFISGIDTDIGKTYATGFIAKNLLAINKAVITQKLIQTGNQDISEDIIVHQNIMKIQYPKELLPVITPYIFSYPASPHLASKMENKTIDINYLTQCTKILLNRYSVVLVEGAGGLCVPINDDILMVEYAKQNNYPIILVTSGRLGSINHTLLSLEYLNQHNMPLFALVYNNYSNNDRINDDTKIYLKNYLQKNFNGSYFWEIPSMMDF